MGHDYDSLAAPADIDWSDELRGLTQYERQLEAVQNQWYVASRDIHHRAAREYFRRRNEDAKKKLEWVKGRIEDKYDEAGNYKRTPRPRGNHRQNTAPAILDQNPRNPTGQSQNMAQEEGVPPKAGQPKSTVVENEAGWQVVGQSAKKLKTNQPVKSITIPAQSPDTIEKLRDYAANAYAPGCEINVEMVPAETPDIQADTPMMAALLSTTNENGADNNNPNFRRNISSSLEVAAQAAPTSTPDVTPGQGNTEVEMQVDSRIVDA